MFVNHLCVLGEMSVWVFCPLFDWAVCFSGIELYELLVYFENPLSIVSFAIIFFHPEGCPFILLISCAKAFKFNQVPLVYFCFYFHYSRKRIIEDLALIYVSECYAYVFL